jgi:DedD protein
MDRNLVERMIGAGVLVLLLVLLVPTLLDGSRDDEMAPANVTLPETVLRTETIYLNGTEPPPAVPDQGAAKTQADLPPLARIRPAGAKLERRPAPVAASTSAPTAASAAASEATSDQWGVQLGSFSNRENANRMVNDLVDQGFPAHVSVTSSGGRSMYRVRVGPRPSRDSAAELARTLAAAGHGGMVMALADEPGE